MTTKAQAPTKPEPATALDVDHARARYSAAEAALTAAIEAEAAAVATHGEVATDQSWSAVLAARELIERRTIERNAAEAKLEVARRNELEGERVAAHARLRKEHPLAFAGSVNVELAAIRDEATRLRSALGALKRRINTLVTDVRAAKQAAEPTTAQWGTVPNDPPAPNFTAQDVIEGIHFHLGQLRRAGDFDATLGENENYPTFRGELLAESDIKPGAAAVIPERPPVKHELEFVDDLVAEAS
jgi:hypothetical protein